MNENQQSQLKELITKGKEQGFLTYAQVNDHLPDDIVDPEQIEDIINMINDMGISVHEVAPDADTLLLNDAATTETEAIPCSTGTPVRGSITWETRRPPASRNAPPTLLVCESKACPFWRARSRISTSRPFADRSETGKTTGGMPDTERISQSPLIR